MKVISTRENVIKTRANDDESDKYRRHAALLGLTLSAFSRLAMNEKADRMGEHPKPQRRRGEGPKCGPIRCPGRRASAHIHQRL
jgi:hypothetical protein